MPVTVITAPGKVGSNQDSVAKTSKDLLEHYDGPKETVLHSSFKDTCPTDIISYENGFVDGIIRAYQQDLHLVLRPDDVWLAIVTQFSFYVGGHAEELRSKFVDFDGQMKLFLQMPGTFTDLDVGSMARGFTNLIDKHIINREVRDWIIPNFSTTTDNDTALYSLAMMATMKHYFKYRAGYGCSFPSVTLLGEVEDWEKMVDRVHQLPQYGKEAAEWSRMLISILSRFVNTFKEPDTAETRKFWDRVCHASGGQGSGQSDTYCGWITAFANWHTNGRLNRASEFDHRGRTILEFDGVKFPLIEQYSIPSGLFEVPVTHFALDEGMQYDTTIVAGSMGVEIRKHEKEGDEVQPKSGWWVLKKDSKPLDWKQYEEVIATAEKKPGKRDEETQEK